MDKQLESREFTEAYQSALEQAARVTKENGKDVSLAQDAVQETIVRLLLRKKKEKIRNWLGFLSTSVRRTVIKLIKRDEAALRPAVTPSCSDLNSAAAIFSRILVNDWKVSSRKGMSKSFDCLSSRVWTGRKSPCSRTSLRRRPGSDITAVQGRSEGCCRVRRLNERTESKNDSSIRRDYAARRAKEGD